jgi:hypothetical protein
MLTNETNKVCGTRQKTNNTAKIETESLHKKNNYMSSVFNRRAYQSEASVAFPMTFAESEEIASRKKH